MKYFSITDEMMKYQIYMCKNCDYFQNKKCEKKFNVFVCAKNNLKSNLNYNNAR